MNLIRKIALREVMKKAVELHKAGNTVEQITDKFWAESQVAQGLTALGIDNNELTKMVEEEIKNKGDK